MEKMMSKLFFDHDFDEFEKYILRYPVEIKEYKAGNVICSQGETLKYGYYVKTGVMQLKIGSEIGKEKTIAFFGKGAMFPLGINEHYYKLEYAMTEIAFTDIIVYQFSYNLLRKMAENNQKLAMRMIEHYCDFTSYLFYENASQAYNTSFVKVVSILEVFHRKMEVCGIIPLSQDLIAEIAGISKIQVARAYKELKEEGIIEIMRNGIVILNENKLAELSFRDVIDN